MTAPNLRTGAGVAALRASNLARVIRVVHREGESSRSKLVAATGLDRSTIGSLVGELAQVGILEEDSPLGRPHLPGRPSSRVTVPATGPAVIAVEIEVDYIRVEVIQLGGERIAEIRKPRSRSLLTVNDTLHDVAGLIVELERGVPADRRPVAVGVSIGALVRGSDGYLHTAPAFGWRDIPLGTLLRERLDDVRPIVIGNDADVGVLAEHMRGAARGANDVIYLSGHAGLGGGVLIGGRLLHGAAGVGGEIGHMVINPGGRMCRCGAVGCWETEVAEDAIQRQTGLAGGRSALEEALRSAEAGDAKVLAGLSRIGAWLGLGLCSLVNIFSPELFVLGGIYGRLLPFVQEDVERELGRALAAPRSMVRVIASELGLEAAPVGAAELAFRYLLSDAGAADPSRDWSAVDDAGPDAPRMARPDHIPLLRLWAGLGRGSAVGG